MNAIHWIDYCVIGVIGLSIITGLFRGFVKELVALCVWVLAIWLGITYSPMIEPFFQPYLHDKTTRIAVSFVIILIGTLIVGGLCNAILSFILRRSGLSGTDRLLGMGFGFIRGVFIVALVIVLIRMTGLPSKDFAEKSFAYAKIEPLADWLSHFMPALVKQAQALEPEIPRIMSTS